MNSSTRASRVGRLLGLGRAFGLKLALFADDDRDLVVLLDDARLGRGHGEVADVVELRLPGSTGVASVALSSDPPLRCIACPATAASLLFIAWAA
jgi:hypothetical protein